MPGRAFTCQNSQERESKIWEIVELFSRSKLDFREQFDNYEWRVLQHSYQKGLHRLDLRLEPDELASLLDFSSLERLRDEYIFRLKDLSHEIFRDRYHADLFDIYVSDLFHEISILKEEHYNVKTYAPQYARDSRQVELSYILDEVHKLFPSKLNHIRYLFERAQQRLEELLPDFSRNRIFIRSLYLQRDDFVKDVYEDGIRGFYRLMYALGPTEGFYEVGMSFYESRFLRRALEVLQIAEQEIKTAQGPPARVKKLEKSIQARLEELLQTDGLLSVTPSRGKDQEAGIL